MKKIVVNIIVSFLCLSSVVLTAHFSGVNEDKVVAPRAATTQVDRRVYVLMKSSANPWSAMYIHYTGGAVPSSATNSPQMIEVVDTYEDGIFYYDIPSDMTTFIVKNTSGTPANLAGSSVDILVSDVFLVADFKVPYIDAFVAVGDARLVTFLGNLPVWDDEAAEILNVINSCSSSYAGGYNAYPQLDDLFIAPNTLNLSTIVTDTFGPSTTIGGKMTYLETRYNLDQGS